MTLLIGFAAVNTGNNLLFLIVSALLAFMAVSGILGWLNIRYLSLQIEVPDEIYEGLPTLVTVRLRNRKRFIPSFLLRIGTMGKTATFILLDGGGEGTTSFVHSFAERGMETVPAAELSSPFPVNFFVRCSRVAVNKRLTVFPAPLVCPVAGDIHGKGKNGALTAPFKGYDGDVTKITDYTGHEPLKLIHWRLSAKHEEFKVKELSAVTHEPVVVDIDSLPGKTLEDNLSCAAYLVNRLIRGNRPVGLKLGERVIAPAASRTHRLRLLTELAVYGKD